MISIPRSTWWKERNNSCNLSSGLHMHAVAHVCTHIINLLLGLLLKGKCMGMRPCCTCLWNILSVSMALTLGRVKIDKLAYPPCLQFHVSYIPPQALVASLTSHPISHYQHFWCLLPYRTYLFYVPFPPGPIRWLEAALCAGKSTGLKNHVLMLPLMSCVLLSSCSDYGFLIYTMLGKWVWEAREKQLLASTLIISKPRLSWEINGEQQQITV